ncbi:asparaginase [Pinisolibacter aquiterrae]|uniref:asparaginase n=1 Tax=Pinisolibacter aquiterrae TaxID=2815579 RepID=UPI001C3CBA75|nr:asparaginase [Pinisolibacter aquiterrae]MBV5263874.1 asparaginase [Pinisolibacter aquiterrae]MCC8235733.1 asparaginase [Pinisolibacter aquiterrae]
MSKRILVVSLGGTISMTATEAGLAPSLDAEDLLRRIPEGAVPVTVEDWSPMKVPSASLTLSDVVRVADELRRRFGDGCDGAVVVQGTDTIEESAFLLDLLVPEDRPVVVTGAMRGPDCLGADGLANLADALLVAAAPSSRGRGTLVVFAGEIHAAEAVRKTHTLRSTAFVSRRGPVLGEIVEGAVRFLVPAGRAAAMPPIDPSRAMPVALVRFALDADDRMLRALPDLGYRGLVIEGAGGGHVAAGWMPAIRDLVRAMPVVLASRCAEGPVLSRTYGYRGSEVDLLAAGVLGAGDLGGLEARLLLTLLLMAGGTKDEVEAEFRARVGAAHFNRGAKS